MYIVIQCRWRVVNLILWSVFIVVNYKYSMYTDMYVSGAIGDCILRVSMSLWIIYDTVRKLYCDKKTKRRRKKPWGGLEHRVNNISKYHRAPVFQGSEKIHTAKEKKNDKNSFGIQLQVHIISQPTFTVSYIIYYEYSDA